MELGTSNSLEQWVSDLKEQGIMPSNTDSMRVNNPKDFELRVILDLEKKTNVKYSEEQKDILLHRGSACILACAGSGKTTTCIHLIAKRILTGEISETNKLLFTTFSKAGVNEMKTRLDKLLGTLGIKNNIQVRTLHSFFLQLLRDFGVSASVIKSTDRIKYIKQACKEANVSTKDEDIATIDTMLSYQVNNIMSDKAVVNSQLNTVENLTVDNFRQIRLEYKNKKAEAGVIDYDDMQTYIYLWLVKFAKSDNETERETAKSVRNYCKAMWDYFFIDEAQDVSKIQYQILREIVADANDKSKLDKTLVFIGDDDQAIYKWRGSDPSIILSIAPEFNLKTLVLSTNYRCGSEIVEYATRGIMCNTQRYAKGMSAYNTGGKVEIDVSETTSLLEYGDKAVKHIKNLIKMGESTSDIAVLARNNSHLAILSAQLFKEGIYCNASSEIKLTTLPVYNDIKKLIEISNKHCYKVDCTSSMLWKLCSFMSVNISKSIGDFQSNSGLDIETAIGYILLKVYNRDDVVTDLNEHININNATLECLKKQLCRLSYTSLQDLVGVYKALKLDSTLCLRALESMYTKNTEWLYKTDEKRRLRDGVFEYTSRLLETDGYEKTQSFFKMFEQFEQSKVAVIGDTVTLTTMHSAKGREWKNVIIFACDNISQPNFVSCKMMLDNDDNDTLEDYIAEERRLFYVASTRAKQSLLVLTTKIPSVFVLEAVGLIPNDKNETLFKLEFDTLNMSQYIPKCKELFVDEKAKYKYHME